MIRNCSHSMASLSNFTAPNSLYRYQFASIRSTLSATSSRSVWLQKRRSHKEASPERSETRTFLDSEARFSYLVAALTQVLDIPARRTRILAMWLTVFDLPTGQLCRHVFEVSPADLLTRRESTSILLLLPFRAAFTHWPRNGRALAMFQHFLYLTHRALLQRDPYTRLVHIHHVNQYSFSRRVDLALSLSPMET